MDLDPVVDPTDPENPCVDPNEPFLTGDTEQDIEQCRSLADRPSDNGAVAIIVPSAAEPGCRNLDIYIDGPAGKIHLADGGDRIHTD